MEVAHLLDPSFHGCHLISSSMHKISQFVQKYYPNDATIIWIQILHYREKSGIFANKLVWETAGKIDPITWWSGNFIDSAPELTQMAKRVLSIPTSSAASERNWSNFAYIHDKKRNRLTPDHVLKLVYIYSNYKLQTPRETSVGKNFLNNSEELDNGLLLNEDNIDEHEESEYEYLFSSSSSSSSENENEGDEESDDFYDSDVTY